MKVDWQQLSPREREVYVRHFTTKQKTEGTATVEGMQVAFFRAGQKSNGRVRSAELLASRK